MATAAHDFLLYVENQINAYEKSVYVLFFVASSLTKRCYNDVIEGRAEDETNDRYESKWCGVVAKTHTDQNGQKKIEGNLILC